MNVYMNPSPHQYKSRRNRPSDGIRRVVEETTKRLELMGWKFVKNAANADIQVGHACSLDAPDVLHCHGLHPTADRSISHAPWVWETNRKVLAAVMRARFVSVPSPWVADIFARDLGFRPVIIRHGIDLNDWPDQAGNNKGRTTILWNKNRDRGVCDVEPMQILAQNNPNQFFTSTFGRSTSNMAVTGLISHKDMKQLLYRTSVYFAPTRETFGIGVLEALAAGCPVIGWDWGHTPNLVQHEVNGYIVDPGDHDGSSEALAYCLDNWARLSEGARKRAAEFTWDGVVGVYDALYHRAMEGVVGPKVSIIIPCYNYEGFVGEAIDSVLAQTVQDWECVIVDDGSTDNSINTISERVGNDGRFSVIRQKNSGVAEARNRGFVESTGAFITFLDADDVLRPEFIQRLLPVIENDASLGIVYGKLGILHNGTVSPGTWPGAFNFDRQLAGHNQIPASNMIRRVAFSRSGGFRQRLAPTEDAELWTRIGLLGWDAKMATKAIVYDYRIHGPSASSYSRSGQNDEPDWRGWLSGSNGGPQPAASIKASAGNSHPVRNYDCPDITVIIPVGDGHEGLLLDAVDSVAAQTYPNWELLVVDDTTAGDLQNHGTIPYHQSHPYIGWLRCGEQNVSTARNIGAAAARGEYLTFLDADDILLKDFMKQTLAVIEEEGPGMVYTDWLELPKGVHHIAEEFSISRLKGQSLFAITFLHPKSAWAEVGGFDESFPGWEDWDYSIALAMSGFCGQRVPQPLMGYRYHTGQRRIRSLELQGELLKKIHAKWGSVEPMPCRGCGRRSKVTLPRVRAPKSAVTRRSLPVQSIQERDTSLIEVEYVGSSQGARIYKCPSNNTYRFGAGRHSRKLVRTEDAEHLKKFSDFVVIVPVKQVVKSEKAVNKIETRQPQSRVPTIRTMPMPDIPEVAGDELVLDDGLVLLDVSEVIRARLREGGWTIGTLSNAAVNDLTPIKAIGKVRATAIIQEAAEVVNV